MSEVRTVKPGHILIAIVDGPDQKSLECVSVFEWDRTYTIPASNDPKFPAFLKRLGLTKPFGRIVDITDRPDIAVGEPFPFLSKKGDE
jgi:hypothetical protein